MAEHRSVARTACIDIGTNSVRYLAAEPEAGGGYILLDRGLASPRLGEGTGGTGRLGAAAIGRTIAALERIKSRLDRLGVKEIRAVGTAALRQAGNRRDFLCRAGELGLEVEVLTGEEEARLIARGAVSGLAPAAGETVLADVGGGSTELIAGGGEDQRAVSLPLGCVGLKERFSPGRDPDRSDLLRMREYCRSVLEELAPGFPRLDPLVGLGGTFTTLAAIRLGLEVYDGGRVHGMKLSREAIESIDLRLRRLSPAQRRDLPGLEPSRADIIIPGIVIVRVILDWSGRDRVTVSDRGLLFGLLEERAGPSGAKRRPSL